jgi:diguanylate cyclase (GGDEF)-like protein
MGKTIRKRLGIFLPALLNMALFGAVVFGFFMNDLQRETDGIRSRQVLAGCAVLAAALMVSGYMVFQGIKFEKERTRMERKRSNLATIDPSTGSLNRRHFWYTASRELDRHKRYFRELALLVMRIDRLKQINDAFGHPVGDRILRELVKHCKSNLRKSDSIGRINGEVFAILLVETTAEAALEVADRLRQQLAAEPFIVDGGIPITVTVTIGVTQSRREDDCVGDVIKRADAAMDCFSGHCGIGMEPPP